MKLELSLPDRPGFLFYIPALDLLALLLAMLTLAGVAAKEGFVEVKVPPSSFRGDRLDDENPVVVMVRERGDETIYYVSKKEVAAEALLSRIKEVADDRKTQLVVLMMDEKSSVKRQQEVIDRVMSAGLRCYLAVRPEQEAARARVVE